MVSCPGPCASSGGRLPEALFMVYRLESQGTEVCKYCRFRQELANESFLFFCKIRLRYSRERASHSLELFQFSFSIHIVIERQTICHFVPSRRLGQLDSPLTADGHQLHQLPSVFAKTRAAPKRNFFVATTQHVGFGAIYHNAK